MRTVEWTIFFTGAAVAFASVLVWLVARRRPSQPGPALNLGLIQPDATPGPPGTVSPAMVGALLDGTVGARGLFLTMIDLAVRGYLRITPLMGDLPEPYDWALRRTDKPERGLRDFEGSLLLTPVSAGKTGPTTTLTALINDARPGLATALDELRGAVARAGWFADLGAVRRSRVSWGAIGGGTILLGLAATVVSLVAGFKFQPWIGLVGAALLVVSGLLLITLTRLRAVITPAGDQTRAQVERYRTWLHDMAPHEVDPAAANELFDTNLAPAFALGLQTQFAEVFDTARARHANWGRTLDIATPWLETGEAGLAQRVKLLGQFLDDAADGLARVGFDELPD